jgi:ferrochelatase
LRAVLEVRRPGRYVVEFGAKHTDPSIEETATALASVGLEPVIGLVLTPHGSSLGSQEYLDRAAAALPPGRLVRVPPWYPKPVLIHLLAARVAEARLTPGDRSHVFFTAHSLPDRVRESGDTYPEQVEESARLVAVAAGLRAPDWSVAWQSAGQTPEPWLGPDVRDEVRRLGEAGDVDAVVVCPVGFVADHLEVLYDLDVEVAGVAAEYGIAYRRTASLNDDPAFIDVLADVVMAADEGG